MILNPVKVELLLRKGAGVQLLSHDASSPMHLAAHAGHVESCELLLKHGAQLNIQDNKGDTPLHKAASNGHLALCQKLISRGNNNSWVYYPALETKSRRQFSSPTFQFSLRIF